MSWEFRFMKFIDKNLNGKAIDISMRVCSFLANFGMVFILFLLVFLVFPSTKTYFPKIALSLIIQSVIVNGVLKPVFRRQRPFLVDETIIPLIKRPKDMSFPSGHTSAAFTFAAALFFQNTTLGIIAYVFAFFVGISRIYLQVHYPTDVIVGAIIGIFISSGVYYLI